MLISKSFFFKISKKKQIDADGCFGTSQGEERISCEICMHLLSLVKMFIIHSSYGSDIAYHLYILL